MDVGSVPQGCQQNCYLSLEEPWLGRQGVSAKVGLLVCTKFRFCWTLSPFLSPVPLTLRVSVLATYRSTTTRISCRGLHVSPGVAAEAATVALLLPFGAMSLHREGQEKRLLLSFSLQTVLCSSFEQSRR